jgi:hypothetical protein
MSIDPPEADRIKEFCLFIFLTGSTGSTGYSPTKQKNSVDPVILSKSMFHMSVASGLNSGQFNRKRNYTDS